MQGLFRRLWQWLKRLLGLGTPSIKRKPEQLPPLTSTDYEFLFMELLEGVAHGWHEGRILKFFQTLAHRSRPKDWVNWLESYGQQVLSSSASNQILAARMIRLGELAQSFPEIEQIGVVSAKIGRELFAKTSENLIWEYDGLDEVGQTVIADFPVPEKIDSSDEVVPETLTLDELLSRLQDDPELARMMGEQLGIETTDADTIIRTLVNQFESTQLQQNDYNALPTTADDWFDRGLKLAEVSDWQGAIACWDQALAIDPDLADAWHNRGSALGMLGRLEEALVSFDRVIAIAPEDPQVWNVKGSALYNLERWQEALNCWDKALELDQEYYPGWYNRGYVLEILGRKEDARASYEKALDIQPDFEVAKARLNDLLEDKS